MATVSTQQPRVRTPEGVLASLFADGPRPAEAPAPVWARPEYKHVGRLDQGQEGIMGEVVQEIHRRDLTRTKQWVVPTDGESALQQPVRRRLRGIPLVLDSHHVLEQRWGAACAFHEEGGPKPWRGSKSGPGACWTARSARWSRGCASAR